jgi:hypothetical protein
VARQAFAALPDRKIEDIVFENFALRGGVAEHLGFYWAEFLARPTPSLMARQAAIYDLLTARGLTVFVPKMGYSPHLTLARLTHKVDMSHLRTSLGEERISMRPALGHSTPNGVMTQEIT